MDESSEQKLYLQKLTSEAQELCSKEGFDTDQIDLPIIQSLVDELEDQMPVLAKGTVQGVIDPAMPKLAAYFLANVDVNNFEDQILKGGLITALQSIFCIFDQPRTKKFLASIKSILNKINSSKETIHVLDAGCGAIPIMSIYSALLSDKIKVTAVEFNLNSFEIASNLIMHLGLEDQIKVLWADATKFEPEEQIDLLISETMYTALLNEPMVQIMSQMKKFLARGAYVLPAAVSVQLGYISVKDYEAHQQVMIQPDLQEARPVVQAKYLCELEYKSCSELNEIYFDLDTSDIKGADEFYILLNSELDLLDERLRHLESTLTTPIFVNSDEADFQKISATELKKASKMIVRYKPGARNQDIVSFKL